MLWSGLLLSFTRNSASRRHLQRTLLDGHDGLSLCHGRACVPSRACVEDNITSRRSECQEENLHYEKPEALGEGKTQSEDTLNSAEGRRLANGISSHVDPLTV